MIWELETLGRTAVATVTTTLIWLGRGEACYSLPALKPRLRDTL